MITVWRESKDKILQEFKVLKYQGPWPVFETDLFSVL